MYMNTGLFVFTYIICAYGRVHGPCDSQHDVFSQVKPLITSLLDGLVYICVYVLHAVHECLWSKHNILEVIFFNGSLIHAVIMYASWPTVKLVVANHTPCSESKVALALKRNYN